ncbi:multidrug efflux SMR transporter [Legionella sp. W05-934-2]|jgi:quaternary ammonium compound-resistance protein SugE|uniref:DMT family transporter n=1 Tax=Legionella sp. W05-934-2 TaxID=1198649 RepID=UPI0034634E1D
MSWFILIFAGLLEVCWAILLKHTHGFTNLPLSIVTIIILIISILLLSIAMKDIPVGTAYAVWTGIGVIGTALIGIIGFGEPATLSKLSCIGLIITGVLGIKMIP